MGFNSAFKGLIIHSDIFTSIPVTA